MSDHRSVHVTADVLYASDLHGQRGLYLDFFEMAWRTRARAAILGGDLAPHSDVTTQRKFYSEFFLPLVREYLSKPGSADLYYIAGNDDWKASLTVVEEAGIDRLCYIHGRSVEFLDGTWIAGLASVPITPFGMKDWDRWEEGLSPRPGWRDSGASPRAGFARSRSRAASGRNPSPRTSTPSSARSRRRERR